MSRPKTPPLSIRRAHYSPMQSPWDYDIVAETADGLPWSGSTRDFLKRFPGGLREWREWRRKALLEDHFDIEDGVMSNPNKVIDVIPAPGFEKGAAAGGGQLRPPEGVVREVYDYVVGLWAAAIAEWWKAPLPSEREMHHMAQANRELADAMEEGAEGDDPQAAFDKIKDRPWWYVTARRPFQGKPFSLAVSEDPQYGTRVEVKAGDQALQVSATGDKASAFFIEQTLRQGMEGAAKMLKRAADALRALAWHLKPREIAALREEALRDARGPVELPSKHVGHFQMPSGEEFRVRVELHPSYPRETNACLKREPTLLFRFADDRIPITSRRSYHADKNELFSTVQHEMTHIMQRLTAEHTGMPPAEVGLSKRQVRTPPKGEEWEHPHSLLEAEFYPSVFQEEQRFRRVLEKLKPEDRWQRLEEMAALRKLPPGSWDETSWFLKRLRAEAPNKWREAMRHILTQIADLLPPREMKAAQLIDWEKTAAAMPEWVLEDERIQLAKDYKDPLEIKESPIHGQGLFALAPFDKGDTVCKALRHVRSTGIADFDLLQTRWGRKINHSEDPNARPEVDPETGDVLVVARRGIDAGDEITVDYDEFGEAVGKVAEDLEPDSRIEVSPGNLQTALSRRRMPLSEIVSLEPPSGRLADDTLVDVRKHGLVTEEGRPMLLDAAAVDALVAAQKELPAGVSIMVMDGFRSQEDQARIVRETAAKLKKSHPNSWKRLLKKYTGGPEELRAKPGPMDHRSGKAVDIKLVGSDGEEIDLGGMNMDETDRLDHYETRSPISRHEAEVKQNRKMLKVLEEHGFKNNPDEWWHWGYEPPISATAASMKHPGPTWQQHSSLLPFMPSRTDAPPGFQKEWDFEKDDEYRWVEGGAFDASMGLRVPASVAEYLNRLAAKDGWVIPVTPAGDGENVMLARQAEEIKGKRKQRLGRLLRKLLKHAPSEDAAKALQWVQKQNETQPQGSKWMLIISAEPSDLRTISTGRGWRSCMTMDQTYCDPKSELESSIKARDLVAYAVDKKGNWLARVVLRFDGKDGWWPEEKVYGQPSSIDFNVFRQAVEDWLNKKGVRGEEGRLSPFYQGWSDKKKKRTHAPPSPEEELRRQIAEEWFQGSEPPEAYKGHGRALAPAPWGQGVPFMVRFRLEEVPEEQSDIAEEFLLDMSEREAQILQEDNPEAFKFVTVRPDLPGFPAIVEVLSQEGLQLLKEDPAVTEAFPMAMVGQRRAHSIPLSTRYAASMKHPGPSRQWKDPDIVTLPFLPTKEEQPPGFQEEWDFEKDGRYRWTEAGTFTSDNRLVVDYLDGSIVLGLAAAKGWDIPLLEILDDGTTYVIGRMAKEIKGGRKMRLGRLLERLRKVAPGEDERAAIADVQRQNSVTPSTSEWMLIISAEPADLRTISTGRGWKSCVTQRSPDRPKQDVETSVDARDMVAYAVDKKGNWLARVVLRFDGSNGWWPEAKIYGQPSSIDFEQFREAVVDWLKKKNLMGRTKQYSPVFHGWSDTLHGGVVESPDEAQVAVERDIAQGPPEPERYKGTGRSFGPAGLYAVHVGIWPTETPNRHLHENIIHNVVSEHPDLELDGFEYAPSSEWAPLLGYVHVKSPDGLRALKSDPRFDLVRRMASAAPLSVRQAASMKHPGPAWQQHPSLMPFLPVRKEKPPGFQEEWDLDKDNRYRWVEGGTFKSETPFVLPGKLAEHLGNLAAAEGWYVPQRTLTVTYNPVSRKMEHTVAVSPYAEEVEGERRMRLGRLIHRLMRFFQYGEDLEALREIRRRFEVHPKSNEWMLIVSAEPADLRTISTGRGWTSCMEQDWPTEEGLSKKKCKPELESSIGSRDMVAYAVDKKGRWLARSVLRFDGKSGWWPDKVYGQPSSISFDDFRRAVDEWLDEKGVRGEEGRVSPFFKGWTDWSAPGKSVKKEKPPVEMEVPELQEPEPPEKYRGTGRALLPQIGPRGGEFLVTFRLPPSFNDWEGAETFGETIERNHPGQVEFLGVWTGATDKEFPLFFHVTSPEAAAILRNHPQTESMVRTASLPLSKRAGRRRQLSDIVSFEPPTGQLADDALVDVRRHGVATEEGEPVLLDAAAVKALAAVQKALPEGVEILVMDGFRSQEDQARIIRETAAKLKKSHPSDWKRLLKKYTGGPEGLREKPGPMDHRSSRAADIKLVDAEGNELEMGGMTMGPEDRLDHYEKRTPANRREAEAKKNRELLRRVMEEHGFKSNPGEWWHWGYEPPLSARAADPYDLAAAELLNKGRFTPAEHGIQEDAADMTSHVPGRIRAKLNAALPPDKIVRVDEDQLRVADRLLPNRGKKGKWIHVINYTREPLSDILPKLAATEGEISVSRLPSVADFGEFEDFIAAVFEGEAEALWDLDVDSSIDPWTGRRKVNEEMEEEYLQWREPENEGWLVPAKSRLVAIVTNNPELAEEAQGLGYDTRLMGYSDLRKSHEFQAYGILSQRDIVKAARKRPGVKEEYIWVWDDGIRKGRGRIHGGRIVIRQNVENGMELKGVDHKSLTDEIGMSYADTRRVPRGFVTYNTDGSVEVATYGAPFGQLLQTDPRVYNIVEERFGLLPGSYKQVVLPMPRGSYQELLEIATGTTGDADDIEYKESYNGF